MYSKITQNKANNTSIKKLNVGKKRIIKVKSPLKIQIKNKLYNN